MACLASAKSLEKEILGPMEKELCCSLLNMFKHAMGNPRTTLGVQNLVSSVFFSLPLSECLHDCVGIYIRWCLFYGHILLFTFVN